MHNYFMHKAIELAKKGLPNTAPNPIVGCILVENQTIIAEGYHQYFGGPHAEVEAIASLPSNYHFENSTLYVTLEPCSHHGKTPPCVNLILEKKIPRVVIGCLDPNPLVTGNSIKLLRQHGIDVVVGILEKECQQLNEIFFKFITQKKPFITMKSAVTLDGKIATETNQSKWISSEQSRQSVHQLRSQYTAIMTGINTVLHDNPLLTARTENSINPIRIIIDSHLRIPENCKIMQTINQARTIIASTNSAPTTKQKILNTLGAEIIICKTKDNKVDLHDLVHQLGKINIDSILLESGGTLNFSMLHEGLIDKIYLYIAPKIFGSGLSFINGSGIQSVDQAFSFKFQKIEIIGPDIFIEASPSKEKKCSQEL